MNIKKLGEFGLINRLTKGIKTDKSVIAGIGDDAAVLRFSRKEHLLLTCDMLVEGTHFSQRANPADIGWKAVCCSVSDIAAMGGEPRWMVVSLGLSGKISLRIIDGIYSGIQKAAGKFRVNIAGGDTVGSEKIIIDVAMLGTVKKENLVLRSGAKPGDMIFVTGSLGGAVQSGRHMKFTPRLAESQLLVNNFNVSAMIDISDGLSSDLGHILRASRAGAVVYEKCLPVSKGSTLKAALCEGEDFELLFTASRKKASLIKEKFARFHRAAGVTEIGRIVKACEGFRLVYKNNRAVFSKSGGYSHFS